VTNIVKKIYKKRSKKEVPEDIWTVFSRSVAIDPPTPFKIPSAMKLPQSNAKSSLKNKLTFVILDACGTSLVLYVFLKLFVFDVDVFLLNALMPSQIWLLNYRFFILLGFLFIVTVFCWKWKLFFYLIYVVFFPFVIIFFKIPFFIYKHKLYNNWIFWIMLMNSTINFFRNFRYYLWSKTIAILALLFLFLSNNKYVIILSTGCLVVLLLIALGRFLKDAFRPSWFFRSQTNFIRKISTLITKQPSEQLNLIMLPTKSNEKKNKQNKIIKLQEMQTISFQIQSVIIATRLLYVWAFKLQQYKQLQLNVIFNFVSYMWIILGSFITFTAINIAVLKLAPHQFSFVQYPSIIGIATYSLSNFVLSDGGGIAANGDISHFIRILSGLYGVFFIGVFIVNVAITVRSAREDVALNNAVEELRKHAKEQEESFSKVLRVSFEEAYKRLVDLGLGGWIRFYNYVSNAVPREFLEDKP
jgi:hypothetical protein